MDEFLNGSGNWLQFGFLIALVFGLYVGLKVLHFVFMNLRINSPVARWFINLLEKLPEYLEPLIGVILLIYFITINPIPHSILVGAVAIFGYSHIKDYITGKMLLYSHSLPLRSRLEYQDHRGVISIVSRFGISLRTDEGIAFHRYSNLYNYGFKIISLETLGGYYNLSIQKSDNSPSELNRIKSTIINSPYTNVFSDIEILEMDEQSEETHFNIHLRSQEHLKDLKALLLDRGFKVL